MWQTIEEDISTALGEPFKVLSTRPVGGGCINESAQLVGEKRAVFVKSNSPDRLAMFQAEAAGLQAIRATDTVYTPAPITAGADHKHSWLALEYINFSAGASAADNAILGEQLAAMHRCNADSFGWDCDNTIGLTPQPNSWNKDWIDFLRQHRIGFQLSLAATRGLPKHIIDNGLRLRDELHLLFSGYQPRASLLHGDLWGGNWGTTADHQPVIYDPAVYFGDREADLAMTELFGGFENSFYDAYNGAWPLDPGYKERRGLYTLYHVLNHFNLFGGSYAHQADSLIARLLNNLA